MDRETGDATVMAALGGGGALEAKSVILAPSSTAACFSSWSLEMVELRSTVRKLFKVALI